MPNDSRLENEPLERDAFGYFEKLTLRYADNDANGHVNNAHYYAFFDTAVEGYLQAQGLRQALAGQIMTPVVASNCRYFREVSYPGQIEVGVTVAKIGRTSIQYAVAIFPTDGNPSAAAQGTFTTVCASRQTRQPVPVPDAVRARFEALGALAQTR